MLGDLEDFSKENQMQITHAFTSAFCNYIRITAIEFVDAITQSEASIVCILPEGIVYGNSTIHVNMYVAWSSADVIHANWGADLLSLSTLIRTLVEEMTSGLGFHPHVFQSVYVTGIENTPKQSSSSSSSSSGLGTAGGIGVSVAAVVVVICVVFVSYFAYSRGYCSSKPTRQSRTLSGMVELSDDAKAPKHQLDPQKVKAADVVPDSVVVI